MINSIFKTIKEDKEYKINYYNKDSKAFKLERKECKWHLLGNFKIPTTENKIKMWVDDNNNFWYFNKNMWVFYEDGGWWRMSGYSRISDIYELFQQGFSFIDVKMNLSSFMLKREGDLSQITEDILMKGLEECWNYFTQKLDKIEK